MRIRGWVYWNVVIPSVPAIAAFMIVAGLLKVIGLVGGTVGTVLGVVAYAVVMYLWWRHLGFLRRRS